MPPAAHSRRRRKDNQSEILLRLLAIVHVLIGRQPSRHAGSMLRSRRHHADVERHWAQDRQGATRHWFVRKEVSVARLCAIAISAIAVMWVGWRIVADTAAWNLAASAPDTARRWIANQPAALDQIAQQLLADPDGDLKEAESLARQALRADPLDERALSLLGRIAERKGDAQKADALMRMAGARSWRDSITQAWLYDRNFSRQNYRQSLQNLDAILRVSNNDLRARLFPALAAFTVDPRAFAALTEFLVTAPPWRGWFLMSLSTALANRSRLTELYAALKEQNSPPTAGELIPYLNRLVRDREFTQAYQTWQDALPPAQRKNARYPYNRDFDAPLDGMPFNWMLRSVIGADVQIVPSPDGARTRALRLQFSGTRVSFANVSQLMLLPPGNYRFSGNVKANDFHTSRGLWWRIYCAERPQDTLGQTDLVSGPLPWTDFSLDFVVPDKGCTAQQLQLELPARVASEQEIEGELWYRYLRIAPAGGSFSRAQ